MPEITAMLWFDGQAEEAANFYVDIFPNSRILSVVRRPPNVPAQGGEVMVVDFELDGRRFSALNGGPGYPFSQAVSFVVHCKDQAETDRYWDALLADGGEPVMCGWLKDRFGLSWQVTPQAMLDILSEGDPDRVARAMGALMTMQKLDLAAILAAAETS